MYTARTVARWFLTMAALSDGNADDMSPTKLHCLMALSDRDWPAEYGQRLFPDPVLATADGPEVQMVGMSEHGDDLEMFRRLPWHEIDQATTVGLIEIWRRYGGLSSGELRRCATKDADCIAGKLKDSALQAAKNDANFSELSGTDGRAVQDAYTDCTGKSFSAQYGYDPSNN